MENRELNRRDFLKLAAASALVLSSGVACGEEEYKAGEKRKYEQERIQYNNESNKLWQPILDREREKIVTPQLEEDYSEAPIIELDARRVEFRFSGLRCPLSDSAIFTVAREQDKAFYGYKENTVFYWDSIYDPIPRNVFPDIDRKAFFLKYENVLGTNATLYRIRTRYYVIFLNEYPTYNPGSILSYKFDQSVQEDASLITWTTYGPNTNFYPHIVNPSSARYAAVGDKDAGKAYIHIVAFTEDGSGFQALERGAVSIYWQGNPNDPASRKILHIPPHIGKHPSVDGKWFMCQR